MERELPCGIGRWYGREDEPEEQEEVPNRRYQKLRRRFYKPTPGRLRPTCWTCRHSAVDATTVDATPPTGRGQANASVQEVKGGGSRGKERNAANFSERKCWFCNEPGQLKRNCIQRKKMRYWTCGHFAANCFFRNRQGRSTVSCLGTARRRRRQPWTSYCSDGEESLLSETLSEFAKGV